MDWKLHFLIAVVFVFVLANFIFKLTLLETIQLSLFAGVSALIPDLDHDMGKARQILNKLVPLILLFVVYIHVCGSSAVCFSDFAKLRSVVAISLALVGLYFVLFTYLKPKHRGITHSIAFALVYAVVVFIGLNEQLAIAGLVGYLLHLLTDNEIKLF